jgi:hypothetical protein
MERIGFDFMCTGEQHHTYHIGALINGYVSELHLEQSCEFNSQLKDDLSITAIHYHSKSELKKLFLKLLLRREKISVVGISSKSLIWLTPLTILGRRIEIHVHGQIAGINNPWKRVFWKFSSIFFSIVVGNPIYSGPGFIKNIGNVGSFQYLSKPPQMERLCILYGSNKSFLRDQFICGRIEGAGIPVEFSLSDEGYVSTNQIVKAVSQATHTFLQLKLDHYLLSPSGRICDLTIYDLKPLVLKEDIDTQAVLNNYGIHYIKLN